MPNQESVSKYLFIAGPGRSGTTLLTLVLSSHPAICLAPENHFIPELLYSDIDVNSRLSGKLLDKLKRRIKRDVKLASLKIDISDYYSHVEKYTEISVREVITDYLEFYRNIKCPNAIYIGQKKNYLEIWQSLKNAIPEAKLITIFRDCRSTASSAARNLPGQTLLSSALSWRHRARQADEFREHYPGDYLEISYETFVREPEQTCRIICDFLSVEYIPEMLTYYQDNTSLSNVLKGQERKHHRTARRVDEQRIDSWTRELTRLEVAMIEHLSGKEMSARHYELKVIQDIGIGMHILLRIRLVLEYVRFLLKRIVRSSMRMYQSISGVKVG